MDSFSGRVAVVTGAGSGIGLGMARTFARAGMSVVLCDIRKDAVEEACAEVRKITANMNMRAMALELDVADGKAMESAAAQIENEFGRIDILCSNAGVLVYPKPVLDVTEDEWDWLIGVNLRGVINGARAFVPRIRKHGQGGHIVNTSSIGGFQVAKGRNTAAYATTKFAVVAFSDGMRNDLEGTGIGVSVLAPSAVNTNIYHAPRHKPGRFGGPEGGPDRTPQELKDGLQPDQVGRRALAAIRDNEFYIFTHMSTQDRLLARHKAIIDAYDATARWCAEEGIQT
jgi:NAD(P)-dependent dehydrogenase (short-subunit alcohol dehydrogenase family)